MKAAKQRQQSLARDKQSSQRKERRGATSKHRDGEMLVAPNQKSADLSASLPRPTELIVHGRLVADAADSRQRLGPERQRR